MINFIFWHNFTFFYFYSIICTIFRIFYILIQGGVNICKIEIFYAAGVEVVEDVFYFLRSVLDVAAVDVVVDVNVDVNFIKKSI